MTWTKALLIKTNTARLNGMLTWLMLFESPVIDRSKCLSVSGLYTLALGCNLLWRLIVDVVIQGRSDLAVKRQPINLLRTWHHRENHTFPSKEPFRSSFVSCCCYETGSGAENLGLIVLWTMGHGVRADRWVSFCLERGRAGEIELNSHLWRRCDRASDRSAVTGSSRVNQLLSLQSMKEHMNCAPAQT